MRTKKKNTDDWMELGQRVLYESAFAPYSLISDEEEDSGSALHIQPRYSPKPLATRPCWPTTAPSRPRKTAIYEDDPIVERGCKSVRIPEVGHDPIRRTGFPENYE